MSKLNNVNVAVESRGINGRVTLIHIMSAAAWLSSAPMRDGKPVIGSRMRLLPPWKDVRDAKGLSGRKAAEQYILDNPHECADQLTLAHLGYEDGLKAAA